MKTANIFSNKGALLAGSLAIVSAMSFSMPAQAAEKTLTLTDKTNTNTQDYPTVKITLKDVAGGVEVQVDVVNSTAGWTGDITGVWFDLGSKAAGSTVTAVSGGPITGISGSAADSGKIGNNADLNGVKAEFNLGVAIGVGGLSNKGKVDDYQTTTFKISGVSVSDFSSDKIGTRMQSVGPNGNRDYSSKTGSSAIVGNNDSSSTTGSSTGGSSETPTVPEETASTGSSDSGSTTGSSTGGSSETPSVPEETASTGSNEQASGGGSETPSVPEETANTGSNEQASGGSSETPSVPEETASTGSNEQATGDGDGGIVISEVAPEPLTIAGTLLGGGALVAWRKRKGNKKAE